MPFTEPFLLLDCSFLHLLQALLSQVFHIVLVQLLKLVHLIVQLIFDLLGGCLQVLFNDLLLELFHIADIPMMQQDAPSQCCGVLVQLLATDPTSRKKRIKVSLIGINAQCLPRWLQHEPGPVTTQKRRQEILLPASLLHIEFDNGGKLAKGKIHSRPRPLHNLCVSCGVGKTS